MSRDMKPRRAAPGRKSGGGTLLGLFIGLVIGVVAVAGVVWYINKAPLPFTTTGQQPKLPTPVGGKASQATPDTPPASGPAALPGKPGDPIAAEKPRFDFYKILPGKAEAIPDPQPEEAKPTETKATIGKTTETRPIEVQPSDAKQANSKAIEAAKSKGDKESALKEPIYLQAGSFQSASDADNQKARLALMGAEAMIQQVMLQDKVWYRVRLGPYHKMDDVNHMRADLAKQGVDANVVRKD